MSTDARGFRMDFVLFSTSQQNLLFLICILSIELRDTDLKVCLFICIIKGVLSFICSIKGVLTPPTPQKKCFGTI